MASRLTESIFKGAGRIINASTSTARPIAARTYLTVMSAPPTRGRSFKRSRGNNRAPHRRPNTTQVALPNGKSAAALETSVEAPSSGATRFSDIPGLSPVLLKGLPFENCTEVQAATLPVILQGNDVLAQAKTGTGKTVAFLLPSIQRLLSAPVPDQRNTSILILSPTRELAQQIYVAADGILKSSGHGKQYGVQVVVGGTNIQTDLRKFGQQRSDILVATPGRLLDLLQNQSLGNRFSQLRTLVLDEADRLLDQGFRRELEKIIGALPSKAVCPRQTLLFSATIPSEVHSIASLALEKNYQFISTLKEEDVNVHEHVKQESMVVPSRDIVAATCAALRREQSLSAERGGFKVMVFLPTARSAAIYHDIFANLNMSVPVWEIHSRMSQSARAKATEAFRQTQSGILFSSDVTARGIDVKGITAVVQVGLPSSADQYIHRLGRTARAGAEGHGIIILGDFESHFLRDPTISSLPLQTLDLGERDAAMKEARDAVHRALASVPDEAKAQAYQAWLGYYKGSMRVLKWDATTLVCAANDFAQNTLGYIGQKGQPWIAPGLYPKTVGMMGLRGTPGLNVVKQPPKENTRAPRPKQVRA